MKTQRHARKLSAYVFLLAGVIGSLIGSVPTASAAEIIVNTPSEGSLAGACTLRDAISAANNDQLVNGCQAGSGADNITFSFSGTIFVNATLFVSSAITIDGGAQKVTIDGQGQVQIFSNSGTLQLRNLTVANGSGRQPHDGTTAARGGGAFNSGSLTIVNCTFSSNLGGGLSGGAIYNLGDVTISGSTFKANWSFSGGGAISNPTTNANLTISNSTFADNIAESNGGAISIGGAATIVNSTFTGNRAGYGAGGAISNSGTLNLANSLLANSPSGGDCANRGVIHSSGVNLVMDGSCSIPGALSGDPMLGPLADNGGPTQTQAPLSGSPVINAGDISVCAAAPVSALDQRGQPRLTDGKCDLGSYESSASAFTITLIPSSLTISRGNVAGFILQLRSVNGFNGVVKLSCSGGPAGTQCGVLPQSVPVNGTAYAVSGILFPRNTPNGTYTITFSGVHGSFTTTATASVTLK